MKAIVQYKYGTADVLERRDIDKPKIEDDVVLVRVHAVVPISGLTALQASATAARCNRDRRC